MTQKEQTEKDRWSDLFEGILMTQMKKDRWLDRKIKTGIPGIWWTERYKKYYAKFRGQILGEFDTEDQTVKSLAKTIRSLKPFQIRKDSYIMKKIEAYEIYKQTQNNWPAGGS